MRNPTLEQTAFPVLTFQQLEIVSKFAELKSYADDEVLIAQGEKDFPFFVISSGNVRIVECVDDELRPIAEHGPGEFTGDVDMLTGRSAVFSAIADGEVSVFGLDAEKLRRMLNECAEVGELLLNAFQARRELLGQTQFIGVRVIGESASADVSRLREFFYKNHVPHTFYDVASEEGQTQLEQLEADDLQIPVVNCNGQTIGNPAIRQIAECIGITRSVENELFDLVIVGSGPSGLAAAVYASSEGIRTLVIDSVGPGGQAGSSSRIENFIGFPTGISGNDLANRGYLQALKFGATFIAPVNVEAIEPGVGKEHLIRLSTGESVRARCVLVASGVTYRQLNVPGFKRLDGAGVFYAATSVESRVCEDATAIVVGGGNSAGQAAMFLAQTAKEVKILIRGDDLNARMSSYLSERVISHPKIEVMRHTEVQAVLGETNVEAIEVVNNKTNIASTIQCAALFSFIGAKPHTAWLPASVLLDSRGFVVTGSAIPAAEMRTRWRLDREPCDLETTLPGIMVSGDVRSGTTKRCGFAVGDGSLAVSCVHRYLTEPE